MTLNLGIIGLGLGGRPSGAWTLAGAALDFDFANGRGFNSIDLAKLTPDSILTYANPSAKMVYGNDGVLRYAPHNLLTYSEQFDNAAWTKSDVTVSANAIAAPNGTVTADQIVESATTAVHRALTAIFTLSAVPYTFSIRVKKNLTRRLYVNADTLMGVRSLFDLSAGTVVSTLAGSATIADIGNDYWLITVTGTGTGASNRVYLQINRASSGSAVDDNYAGDGASGIYVWGAQLNLGSSALTYIPTTTAAVYSLPIDHNPTTFEPLGVLIEEERKNLLMYSEQFDNAAWSKTQSGGVTVTSNQTTSPDGVTSADLAVPNAVNGYHVVRQGTASTAAVHTHSLYVKASGYTKIGLREDYVVGQWAAFNLSTGAVIDKTAAASASITAVGNGWYRLTLTPTTASVNMGLGIYVMNDGYASSDPASYLYTGNGTSGAFIWGAQLEAGAFATSYIHTTNNPLGVTRLADQVSILTSAFAYNAAAGTCAVETYNTYSFNFPEPWYLGDSAAITTKRIQTFLSGTSLTGRINDTTEQALVNAGSITLGAFNKFSMAWAVNNIGISLNAGAVVPDTGATIPSTINQFGIGGRPSSGQINGHIKRLTYFPTRKSDAELQVLST